MTQLIDNQGSRTHNFVNDSVSWQSKVTVSLMRNLIKKQIAKTSDVTKLRRFAHKVDVFTARNVSDLIIKAVDANGIPCQWLTAPSKMHRVILYLHGGGFCIHLPQTYQSFVAQLCRQLDANALIPDYRLAPEHPFPAGVSDCLTSYRWLLAQGYEAQNIIIAGDSAGGCLTLTTLQQIRDAGLDLPAAAITLSPGTDLSHLDLNQVPDAIDEGDPMLSLAVLNYMIEMYIPDKANTEDPLLSPVFGDFTGLPPIQCHVGSTEIIYSHSLRAMQKAKDQGVDATLHVWKGMPHVHPLFPWLPESKQAIDMMTNFMSKHLA